ncbi:MAG: hypothetical protein KIS66_12315 [Fimbriimonadaceae bacterium]|nr:hypothetical protein [Fimbriimonadaceae bacterium]
MAQSRSRTALAAALVLGACAHSSGQSAVTLRMKPTVGQKYAYTMVMDNKTTGMGGTGSMSMKIATDMVYTIKARKGTNTTMETATTGAKVTAPQGSPMAGMAQQLEKQLKGQTMTVTLDEFGKMVSSPGANPALGAGANTSVEYPKNPVSVGSTWSAVVDMGKILAAQGLRVTGGRIPFNYRVTKIEAVGGKTLVHLTQAATGKFSASGAAAGGGAMAIGLDSATTMVVDAGSGMIRTSKGTMTMTMAAGQMKMTQTMIVDMRLR